MDDIDIVDEGVIVRQGKFIEKNRDQERVMEKRCKRCQTVLTLHEDDYGSFKLWCISCDAIALQG
jgi:hypothetical protein